MLEGTGGVKGLDDDDKANIDQTVNDEVLKGRSIEFQSSAVERWSDGSGLNVQGELALGDGQARSRSSWLCATAG